MNILSTLPLAFVMIAGPQIISAVFLATSERWQANSAAYVFGASLSITAIVTAAYLVANSATSDSASSSSSSDEVIDAVIVGLLLLAAFYVYRGREKAEPPKWMGRLQEAAPPLSFKLGFLLLGIFPTDIATSVTVGAHLARHDESWAACLPFVGLTLLLLSLPAILLLLFGRRAKVFLPKARAWMNANSWMVSEAVIGLFIVITLS